MIYDLVFDGALVALGQCKVWEDTPASLFVRHPLRNRVHKDCRTQFVGDKWHVPIITTTTKTLPESPQSIGHVADHVPTTTQNSLRRHLPLLHGRRATRIWDAEAARSNLSLLFVSKQLHQEFAVLVYSRCVFWFDTQNAITRFLSKKTESDLNSHHLPRHLPVIPTNLALITFLCLDCAAHGLSNNIQISHLQATYYTNWSRACHLIATSLPNLTDLTLFIDIPLGGPYKLSLDSIWARPFLELAGGTALVRAAINISAPPHSFYRVSNFALNAFVEVMRRVILGWDGASALEAVEYYAGLYPDEVETWKRLRAWNAHLLV